MLYSVEQVSIITHGLRIVNTWLTIAIVTLTYIGIALGRFPRLKTNRATVALIGVGLLLISGQVHFEEIGDYLDLDTLVLLFSMMVINANLRIAGFFTLAGSTLLRLARTPRLLLALEIALVGVLSALFLNDTICLMFTPLVLELTTATRRNPLPYLIALATASNLGSVATLTGNPQNMIIGIASGIPYIEFTLALLPVALAGMVIIWVVLVWLYRYEFTRETFPPLPQPEQTFSRWSLTKNLIVIAALLAAFLAGVPVALATFLAACALLITRRVQPQMVFAEFDWGLLVFFSGLFIVSGSLERNGITRQLFEIVHLTRQTGVWEFSIGTAVLSNLVSNVPAVLLLKPVTAELANPRAGWLALALASTLAGNFTLLGSVANLIVAEIASRWRVEISFWEYLRAGAIITIDRKSTR